MLRLRIGAPPKNRLVQPSVAIRSGLRTRIFHLVPSPTTTTSPAFQVDKEHRLTSRAGEAFGGAMDGVANAVSQKESHDEHSRWGSAKK